MSFLINTPPTLDGDNATKILQLYKHLYKMSEEVNYALNALAEGNVVDLTGTTDARKNFSTAIMGGNVVSDTPSLETYNELKSLIIKTGKAVNESISVLDEKIYGEDGTVFELQQSITALKEISYEIEQAFGVNSEYGSYAEAISNKMSISAKNVVQEYKIISRLDSADEKATGFAEWINVTDSYIKTGVLYTDSETGIEQVGVAIGANMATSIVDGVVQPDTNKTDLLATFVSDSLIFWQKGRKVAYFSNKKLYVLSAEFLGSYRIGDFQWVNADVGLILEWVGEDNGE